MRRRFIPNLFIAWPLALALGLAAAPTEAGFSFKKGSFSRSTATGSQSITGVGFQPKAIIFFWTQQTSAGLAADANGGAGFTTSSSNERAVAYFSDDALDSSNTSRRTSQTNCILIFDSSGTFGAQAALTSLDADGFTLAWTVTSGATADIVHYVALGGTDLTNATASSFSLTSGTGSQSVTGIGFQPDFIMFLDAFNATNDTTTTLVRNGMGFASSASSRAALAIAGDDGKDTSDTYSMQRTDNAIAVLEEDGSSVNTLADLTSFDADGFTVNKSANITTHNVHYLALKGGQYKVGNFNKSTNTTTPVDQSVTDVGFRPVGLLMASFNLAASTSIQTEARMSLGAADGPPATNASASEGSTWWHDKHNVGTMDANQRTSTTKIATHGSQSTLSAEADFKSFDSGGFTLTWTTNNAVAEQILYVAFGHTSTSAVTLGQARAIARGGLVQLRWRTSEEINNLGFHVYREGPDGVKLRLTPELLTGSAFLAGPGHALTSGRRYRVWDDLRTLNDERGTVNSGLSTQHPALSTSVRYWIEDVDLNGTRTMHGPIVPQARGAGFGARGEEEAPFGPALHASRTPLHAASALSGGAPQLPRTVSLPEPTPSTLARQAALLNRPSLKLLVRQEGWQRLGRDALLAQGLPAAVDPRTFRLFVDAQELPLQVTGEADGRLDPGDTVGFYGLGLDTPQTDIRVYWLTWGQGRGLRLAPRHASSVDRQTSNEGDDTSLPVPRSTFHGQPLHSALNTQHFPFTVDLAPKRLYVAAIKNGEAENFYGGVVRQSGAEFSVTLVHVDPAGPATLDLRLQGFTEQPHAVTVSVNGTVVGSLSWSGQTLHEQRFTLHAGLLLDGSNQVRLQATGDETDVSLIAQLHLTYAHTNQVTGDALRVTLPAGTPVTLTGFIHPEILVLDVTDPDAPLRLAGRVASSRTGGYAVTTVPTGSGLRTLYVVSRLAAQTVAGLTPKTAQPRPTRRPTDLLILTPAAWQHELAPLAQLRQRQGLRVDVQTVESVYDRFSFGQKDPATLKQVLTQSSARYALLIGGASLDPRDYLGQHVPDILPTKLIETAVLETASDDWFGDVDNDGIPEVVVGRLPARLREELQLLIRKLVTAQPFAEALLVSDNPDVYDFPAATAQLKTQLPPGQPVTTLTVDPANPQTTKSALLAQLNHGPALVHYLGHGSVGIWAGEGILTSEDAQTLTNGARLPIVVALNCLNSFFHDVYTESLGEALLTAPQGGAQAVWASSGMTTPGQQVGLDTGFFARPKGTRLGDRIRAAKAAVSDPDVRRTWVLLGDPSTPLP